MSDMDYDKISDLIWEQSYRDDGDGMRAAGEAFDHLRARVVELEGEVDRLRDASIRPAPCARHCEANAFEIEIRQLNGENKRLQKAFCSVTKAWQEPTSNAEKRAATNKHQSEMYAFVERHNSAQAKTAAVTTNVNAPRRIVIGRGEFHVGQTVNGNVITGLGRAWATSGDNSMHGVSPEYTSVQYAYLN